MKQIFILLVIFQIKHYLADYRWQTAYMLQKLNARGWAFPLATHALVHASITLLIATATCALRGIPHGVAEVIITGVVAFDFGIHFTVDRIKANLSRGVAISDPRFWRLLGMDQAAHHLTHYAIIAVLIWL